MGIESKKSLDCEVINADLCIIGGGIAGINAALSASRLGVKTVLMHERPVLGGNASGEIRMWICGDKDYRYKETGIAEEIALENYYYNENKRYPFWDALLYKKVTEQENLVTLLNTTCFDAKTDGKKIVSVTGYQLTTQKLITVIADNYIDCSGDSILAPLTGARFMIGREDITEFNESQMISHTKADKCTMGNSLLMQAVKRNKKVKFVAPSWVEKVSVEKLKSLNVDIHNEGENFWYIEIGGTQDTISDAESINRRLVSLCLGIWDTIKNSGEFDADYFDLDFLGFIGAKRESRRMLGDYVLTGNDIINRTQFADEVAYGGWGLDDHMPQGFDGNVPNLYIPIKTYGIPFRSLYSKDIENLMFAGRNISLTHFASSSARVMGTCGCLGSATGTAAYLLKKYQCYPRDIITKNYINELQQLLLLTDNYLPNFERKVSPLNELDKKYSILHNGYDRNISDENRMIIQNNTEITYDFGEKKHIKGIKIVFDSDLLRDSFSGISECEKHHNMRCSTLEDSPTMHVPKTLAKDFTIIIDGESKHFKNNLRRNVLIQIDKDVQKVSLMIDSNWGDALTTPIFTFEVFNY